MHPLRKRRTREHIIADLSANHVERFILRCGWVAQRMSPDYGMDMYMQTFNANGEIEPDGIWMQLKATDKLVVVKRRFVAVRLQWSDMLFWLNELLPVIVVIYDATADRAWWVHLQATLRTLSPKTGGRLAHTVTVHIPLENPLDEAAIRSFAKLRDAVLLQAE